MARLCLNNELFWRCRHAGRETPLGFLIRRPFFPHRGQRVLLYLGPTQMSVFEKCGNYDATCVGTKRLRWRNPRRKRFSAATSPNQISKKIDPSQVTSRHFTSLARAPISVVENSWARITSLLGILYRQIQVWVQLAWGTSLLQPFEHTMPPILIAKCNWLDHVTSAAFWARCVTNFICRIQLVWTNNCMIRRSLRKWTKRREVPNPEKPHQIEELCGSKWRLKSTAWCRFERTKIKWKSSDQLMCNGD